jgi:hypothetical protein
MRKLRIGFFCLAGFFLFTVFMESAVSESKYLTFSVNGSSSGYAATDIKIADNHFTMLMRGNTHREGDMRGIGVFEGTVDDAALADLRKVADTMRVDRNYVDFYHSQKFLQEFYDTGLKATKLDVTPTIAPWNGRLLLTLAFQNSGRTVISLSSPSEWEGVYNTIPGTSWVIASAVSENYEKGNDDGLRFNTGWIGAAELVNHSDFPDEILSLRPGETRYAKFVVFPSNSFKKGRYRIGMNVAIKQITEPQALKGNVEFVGQKNYVNFPHDYPSTPEEIAAFTAHQREENQ